MSQITIYYCNTYTQKIVSCWLLVLHSLWTCITEN